MPSVVSGVNGIAEQFEYPESTPKGPYRILNQYHSKPRRLRVACVGAGASGLCLAYKMNKMLEPGSWELTLFEKNPKLGGTWLESVDRYAQGTPGVTWCPSETVVVIDSAFPRFEICANVYTSDLQEHISCQYSLNLFS